MEIVKAANINSASFWTKRELKSNANLKTNIPVSQNVHQKKKYF